MTASNGRSAFAICPAQPADVPAIHAMIRALADYERLTDICVATEADLERALFGSRAAAEVLVAWKNDEAVAFALFFHNFSTFLGRRGTLARRSVRPPRASAPGMRERAAARLGRDRPGSQLRQIRMGGAGLERSGHPILRGTWGNDPARLEDRAGCRSVAREAGERRPRERWRWLRQGVPFARQGHIVPIGGIEDPYFGAIDGDTMNNDERRRFGRR